MGPRTTRATGYIGRGGSLASSGVDWGADVSAEGVAAALADAEHQFVCVPSVIPHSMQRSVTPRLRSLERPNSPPRKPIVTSLSRDTSRTQHRVSTVWEFERRDASV